MDARSLQPPDLVELLGSSEIATGMINGEEEINEEQAKLLGQFFHVGPQLFLSN